MKKGYVLLVDDEWEFAELTNKDVERIKADLNGEFAEQYLIKLSNGETVDVGIIDDIKEAEEYYKNKMYEAMQILIIRFGFLSLFFLLNFSKVFY
jgi:hypothetical protein